MATARINVFCTTEELSNWLAIIVSKYQLHSIWFTLQDDYSKQLNILTEKIPAVAHRIYLMPYNKFNNRKIKFSSIGRCCGWIEIKPGHLVEYNGEKILQLTEISTTDSEDKLIFLCKAINWLKRQIKTNEFSGVIGKNIVYGRENIYPHILYTYQAKSLFYDKVIWKQDLLFNSVYKPLIS
ncbi:hypothetical protein OM361_08145 [Escherichia albertii]|nr:hypothetical protein [Escherichia albertii]